MNFATGIKKKKLLYFVDKIVQMEKITMMELRHSKTTWILQTVDLFKILILVLFRS
jgi:hypothetical protein